ncbi:MAG: ABC transporter permease, partial [Bacteroidota bacterium]
VEKTLRNLGLGDISDLKVGNALQKTISGGQRKRLNIGLELLREPSVLFLDEPTSGLSSNDSENIMDLLKELSLKGKLIFVVIHQPSSDIFKMFDRLIILDIGGYQIYYGNPIEAVTYFKTLANLVNPDEGICPNCGNVNPEQIFNIIETKVVDEYGRYTNQRKVSPVQWRKHYEDYSPQYALDVNTEKPSSTLKLPSRFRQLLIFARRDMLAKLSNTQYMVISLLEAPVLAFILSYIVRYYHVDHSIGKDSYIFGENINLPAYIFMSIIVSLFIGLTVSAEEIIKDAKILKREAFLHLSRTSYLLSKIFILFSFSLIQTISYVLIGNWILEIEGTNFYYVMVLFTTSCFANMLGLNISSTFNSVITIYILIPIILIPQLILGGIVVEFDDINPKLASENKVPLISELMTSRWAFEAIMVSQFKHNPFEKRFYRYDKQKAISEYKRTYYIPELETSLSYCMQHINSTDLGDRQMVEKNIRLLSLEVAKETRIRPHIPFTKVDRIHPDLFDIELGQELADYLEALKNFYTRAYNRADQKLDKINKSLTLTDSLRKIYQASRARYHNQTIEDMVTKTNEKNRIVEIDEKLIRKIYPVFHDP